MEKIIEYWKSGNLTEMFSLYESLSLESKKEFIQALHDGAYLETLSRNDAYTLIKSIVFCYIDKND